jgi:hypothetical protein
MTDVVEYTINEEDLTLLRESVLEHDKNASHYYYDKILHDIASSYAPEVIQFLDAVCYGDTNGRD